MVACWQSNSKGQGRRHASALYRTGSEQFGIPAADRKHPVLRFDCSHPEAPTASPRVRHSADVPRSNGLTRAALRAAGVRRRTAGARVASPRLRWRGVWAVGGAGGLRRAALAWDRARRLPKFAPIKIGDRVDASGACNVVVINGVIRKEFYGAYSAS